MASVMVPGREEVRSWRNSVQSAHGVRGLGHAKSVLDAPPSAVHRARVFERRRTKTRTNGDVTLAEPGTWLEAEAHVRELTHELARLAQRARNERLSVAERHEAATRIQIHWLAHKRFVLADNARPVEPIALPSAGWIRVTRVSELTKIPSRTLRRWCDAGELRASKRGGGFWYIDARGLEEKLTKATRRDCREWFVAKPRHLRGSR